MRNIVMISPKFEPSFWGLEYVMPVFRKSAIMPNPALPLLAALTPASYQVRIIDENVEEIDFDSIMSADIVALTGMIVQRKRMREILEELKKRDLFTVVGGGWITVKEDAFDPSLHDVIFVGEAEETWPRFLEDWENGRHAERYEQESKTVMATVPTPAHNLIKMDRYLFANLQISRGCPFNCEFCDIIVTFGRRPRVKTPEQVISELESIKARKITHVFVVDDNLIGNRKAVLPVLKELAAWQKRNNYHFSFFTEISINLSEDQEFMDLLVEANFQSVFIGIETPDDASLKEAKKMQNLNRGTSLVDRVRRIQDNGIETTCGMIVGFDNDTEKTFAKLTQFLIDARIAHAMLGMLFAIPKTPLYTRLEKEGRLDMTEDPDYGTNVIPLNMSREELTDGYIRIMKDLYSPDAFFDRVDDLYLQESFIFDRGVRRFWKGRPNFQKCLDKATLITSDNYLLLTLAMSV